MRGFLVSNLCHVEGWHQQKIGLIKQWTWCGVYSDWVFLFSSLTRSDSCCDLYLALRLCHSCSHLSTEKVIQKKWGKKVRERRQCWGCFEKWASYPKCSRWKSERVLLLIGSDPLTCKDVCFNSQGLSVDKNCSNPDHTGDGSAARPSCHVQAQDGSRQPPPVMCF